jgi:hypothetical protein
VRRVLGRVGLGVVLLATAATAWAHSGGSTGYALITISRSTVRYRWTLPTSALPSNLAEALRLAQTNSPLNRDKLLDVIRTQIVLHANGTRCEPGPGQVLASAFDATSFTMLVDFACGSVVRELVVQDNTFDLLGTDHHTLAKLEAPSGTQQFAFAPDTRQARFVASDGGDSARSTGSFFVLGIHHILSGYDHLIFLLGLLLPGGGVLSLAKIITAFTIAHSVTLSLAVLQIVTLPDRLVEAVIALSIAFVAAENLFLSPVVSRRWLVSLCFGLVHGFGFSSALRELGLPTHGLLLSLFGFNAGVEVGQALVVALALPALMLVRTTRWEQRVIWSSSLAILLVGVILFVERAFF